MNSHWDEVWVIQTRPRQEPPQPDMLSHLIGYAFEVLDELITDVGKAILRRHPKERREHVEFRDLVSRRESGCVSQAISSHNPHHWE